MPTLAEQAAIQSKNRGNPWIPPTDIGDIDEPPPPNESFAGTPTEGQKPGVVPQPLGVFARDEKEMADRDQLKADREAYLAAHPEAAEATKNPHSMFVRPTGDGPLLQNPFSKNPNGPERDLGEIDEPPPPPPGMLPTPAGDGAPAAGDNPEAIASGKALPASVRGPAGPSGPAALSPDRQYEQTMRSSQEQEHAAFATQQESIQARKEGLVQGARDLATAQTIRDDQVKKNQDEIDFQQAVLNQESAQRTALRHKKAEEVRAMHADPHKWYKDRGTAGSILTAIVSGFGAFGANMPHSGGKNVAQDILNKSQNDELDAQKSDIENAQKDLDMNVAEDDREYARGQHKIATLTAASSTYWNHAQAQIQDVMSRTDNQQKLAAMGELSSYVEKQKIEADKKYAEIYRDVGNHELTQQQAARAAAAQDEKTARNRIYDLSAKLLTDPNAQITEEAAKRGISREQMALMSATALVRHDSRGAGLVNVAPAGAAGKLTEDQQNVRATDEFNSQIADIKKSPIITGTGLGTAALATLPQRVAPGANREQTELDAINTRMLQAIGKVAKDADGKPNKEMIQRIEKTYAIHLGEPPEQKIAKLTAVQDIYNSLARQQGAANAPLSTKK